MQRLAIFVLAALVAVGCGGGDNGPPGSTRLPGSSTTTAPTTSTTTVESAVEEAYLAYWEMGERLLEAPNPDDPEIAEWAVDPALSQMVDSLTTLRSQDRAVRRGNAYGHRILGVEVHPESATVRDCVVDDGAVVNVVTDETIDERVTTVLLVTTLQRQGGSWRVSEVNQHDSWQGVATCDG